VITSIYVSEYSPMFLLFIISHTHVRCVAHLIHLGWISLLILGLRIPSIQWPYSPYMALASSRLLFRFRNGSFYGVGLLAPRPNPTWRTRSPYLWPTETVWPSYTPGHWVVQVPRGCHSPYPLLWAREGRPSYYANNINCEAPHYVTFFALLLLLPSYF
jgi:hypothetical protein